MPTLKSIKQKPSVMNWSQWRY